MAVKILEDVLEDIANSAGIYGERRAWFVSNYDSEIRNAMAVEKALETLKKIDINI